MKTKFDDSDKNQIAGGENCCEILEQTEDGFVSENLDNLEKVNNNLQSGENSDSFGKFKSANDLLKAYNCLQAEFTKRSQLLRALERELVDIKKEQEKVQSDEPVLTVSNTQTVQDETGSAVEGFAGESLDCFDDIGYDEGRIAIEVSEFLSEHPEATAYAEQIADMTSKRGDLSKGFLQKAYVAVLNNVINTEREKINDEFILQKALESSFVKEKIIRDYLSGINANKSIKLLSGGGEIAVIPPNRPKNISEAGEMAVTVLRSKNS